MIKRHTLVPDSFFSLGTMSAEVSKVLQLFAPQDLDWKPLSWEGIPGEKFSAIEQICHLRDIEQDGYHHRIAAVLDETNPVLPSIEGYALATQRNYQAASLTETIAAFHTAREKTISLIQTIEGPQWNRTGYFEGYGNITLRALVHFLCSHDLEHLASLRWLLGKLAAERLNE